MNFDIKKLTNWKNAQCVDISIAEIINHIDTNVKLYPKDDFRLIIGTDSQNKRNQTNFATVIIFHREGKGATFWFAQATHARYHINRIADRLIAETTYSIEVYRELLDNNLENILPNHSIEIHLDVGMNGASKKVLQACTSYVQGMGVKHQTKPNAPGVMLADKLVKTKNFLHPENTLLPPGRHIN